jgi:hypothetical protein
MASTLEIPVAAGLSARRRWWWVAPLLLAMLVYLVLALWLADTKAPWYDEGQYTNSAYNLAFRGNMGSNVVEPTGFYQNVYYRGVQQWTYFELPNHILAMAAWIRIFGFSAFTARSYSICWGAVTLAVLFFLLQRAFPDRRVATLGTLFTAIDFIFLWSSADTRMDVPANALALGSLSAYLYFREKDLWKAVLASQVLGAGAVFTHPNTLLVLLGGALLAWRHDRNRLRIGWPRYLALGAAPYALLALMWGVYILQNPADFKAQFIPALQGHDFERFRIFTRPYAAVGEEIHRHLAAYCASGLWGGAMRGWMGLVLFFYLAAIIWFFWNWRRQEEPVRMFREYAIVMLLGMTFLNGFKGYFYLIYLAPIYNSILAAWLLSLGRAGFDRKCLAVAIGAAFAGLQLTISIVHIRADEYHRDYQPAIRDLARDRAQGKSIVGDAALGFGLDFSGFTDDVRLGMYSGRSPDVIVVDRAYRRYSGLYRKEEPAVFRHIITALSRNYRLTAQYGSFWIFERAQPGPDGRVTPWVDARIMENLPDMDDTVWLVPRDFQR